ncbi:CRISPR-associated protein Cas5 [Actinomadura spongiicola]|uniref:CRISPR-associated protein Cas5 n=1 Tax=Actinomadura spongiicola TaxID=2303421 RepID=UPI001F207E6D|nr:CRISPR-associated protein Cas5 [Actinomadura spongiicola]
MTTTQSVALEATFTAPVASFRNPLYAGVQVTLPCPSPATVGGLLAGAAGGWDAVDRGLRFAMAFRSGGKNVDYETYHPLDASGKKASPTPRHREFLAAVVLTVWLLEDVDGWWRRLRRPVWPLRLGRSQDLVGVSLRRVTLAPEPGALRLAIVPDAAGVSGGTPLRLPTAVGSRRDRTKWDTYRYDSTGLSRTQVPESWSTEEGQAVALLPVCHPDSFAWR